MSLYRVVCGKPCHLPVEIEHKAWWAIRKLSYDLTEAGEERRLQLSELDEIRVEAYESCLLYTSPSPRDGLLSRMPSSA